MAWTRSQEDWQLFLRLLSAGGSDRVLDVGAGKGLVASRVLSASAAEVHALEPDEARVAAMRREAPGVQACQGSAERIPFPDSYFSRVYSTMAAHHFSDLGSALAEISRVLEPDGTLLIMDVDPSRCRGRLLSFFENGVLRRHHSFKTLAQLVESLSASGKLIVIESAESRRGYVVKCGKREGPGTP